VFEVLWCFQQRLDFGLTQNDRQFLLMARQGDSINLDAPVQSVLVGGAEFLSRPSVDSASGQWLAMFGNLLHSFTVLAAALKLQVRRCNDASVKADEMNQSQKRRSLPAHRNRRLRDRVKSSQVVELNQNPEERDLCQATKQK